MQLASAISIRRVCLEHDTAMNQSTSITRPITQSVFPIFRARRAWLNPLSKMFQSRSNFLSELLLNFQQIKFNDKSPLSPWNVRLVSAFDTGKLDLNRGDFAPHLSTSFRRWLHRNNRWDHLFWCRLWFESLTGFPSPSTHPWKTYSHTGCSV